MTLRNNPVKISRRSYELAITALIVSNIIWGAAPPVFKYALSNIPPFSLAFLRFFIAALLLLPFLYKYEYWKIKNKDWILIIQNTFFGVTAGITFFFLGLKLAPSINASLIASTSSIFTTLLAFLLIRERPSRRVLIGDLLGLLGVILVILKPNLSTRLTFNFREITGNIFFILATLSTAGQAITSRKLAQYYRSRTFTFYSFLIGSLSFLPLAIVEIYQNPSWPINLDERGIVGIIFGSILSSLVAYTIWGFAAEKITASEIGLYMYINPLVTVLIAVPLLSEKISIQLLIGSLLSLSGIYIAEKRIPYLPIHHQKRSPKLE